MKHLTHVVFLLLFLFTNIAFAENKKIDAPAYTQKIKNLYINGNSLKVPVNSGYSSVPGSSFWRDVRSGEFYKTQIKGDDTGILINATGEDWMDYRQGLTVVGGSIIGISILLIITLIVVFGQFKIKKGFSGHLIERFSFNERVIHWGTAFLFILLGLTGITILLGKYLIVPLVGKEFNAIILSFSKEVHNLFGPVFSIFLIVMIVRFIKDNFYQKGDIEWLLHGGGLFGKHVDSWRFNLGEKGWFWISFFAGIILSVSGYILLFTDLVSGQREAVELSHILHTISAILMISALFGHIYMAITLQGSLSAMTKGKVDKNWAKEHHSLWYKKQKSID